MIHVVTAGNRSLYRRELAMMHAQRAAMFIDQLGWPLQRDASGGESDPGDDDLAIYFLVLEADGALAASCRLRPTIGWSLLGGPAGHLAPGDDLARRTDTWELSRILLLPPSERRPGHVPPAEVRLAVLEEACERGVRRLVGLADGLMEEVLMRSGMAIGKLGPTLPLAPARPSPSRSGPGRRPSPPCARPWGSSAPGACACPTSPPMATSALRRWRSCSAPPPAWSPATCRP